MIIDVLDKEPGLLALPFQRLSGIGRLEEYRMTHGWQEERIEIESNERISETGDYGSEVFKVGVRSIL